MAQTAVLELEEANITVNVIPPSVIDAPAARVRRHMPQPSPPDSAVDCYAHRRAPFSAAFAVGPDRI